jgi:hypothetical protein
VSLYYKSRTANIATAGIVRLANADLIEWRNAANGGNLTLGVDSSDRLVYNGVIISNAAFTAKSFLYSDAAGVIASTAAPTNGQFLIGSTGNIPVLGTITGTANQIVATLGSGTITLSTPQNINVAATPTFASETLTAVTNQLVLGTTNTTTITSPAPAASRVYTIPDAGTTASFMMTQAAQTVVGQQTFSAAALFADGTVSLPGISFNNDQDCGMYRFGTNAFGLAANGVIQASIGVAGVILRGTTTNDSAATGMVGEYVTSLAGFSSAPTSGEFGDLTSISLTAGDWNVTFSCAIYANGATVTRYDLGISVTAGNFNTGLVEGDTQSTNNITLTSTAEVTNSIPERRFSLSGTTTVYAKMYAIYSVATPQFKGRLSARRIR